MGQKWSKYGKSGELGDGGDKNIHSDRSGEDALDLICKNLIFSYLKISCREFDFRADFVLGIGIFDSEEDIAALAGRRFCFAILSSRVSPALTVYDCSCETEIPFCNPTLTSHRLP